MTSKDMFAAEQFLNITAKANSILTKATVVIREKHAYRGYFPHFILTNQYKIAHDRRKFLMEPYGIWRQPTGDLPK
jgi:hypothetical protein